MPSSHRTWQVNSLLSLGLILCALGAASSGYFHRHISADVFFSFALLSVVILHLSTTPSWKDGTAVLLTALALGFIDFICLGDCRQPASAASFLGLGSLLVLGLRVIWAREDATLLRRAFLAGTLFPAMAWAVGHGLNLSQPLHPRTWDLALYSFDCSLGMQISYAAGRFFVRWTHIQWLCKWAYYALPLPMALVFASHLKHRDAQGQLRVALALVLAGPIGWLFFNLLPGTGPIFVFPDFPREPFATAEVANMVIAPIPVSGLRNAIPSMHFAWIVLAWWNSRSCPPWVRSVVAAFVVLTLAATVGFGQHYFIDLVVALPFAVMLQALATLGTDRTSSQAWTALSAGLAGTLCWLALIRYATRLMWITPVLPWTLIAATIVGYLALEDRLARAYPAD